MPDEKKAGQAGFLFDRPRFPGAFRFAVGQSDEDEVAGGQAAALRGQTENADFMHRLGEVGSAAGERGRQKGGTIQNGARKVSTI